MKHAGYLISPRHKNQPRLLTLTLYKLSQLDERVQVCWQRFLLKEKEDTNVNVK